jgi:hypothetical protein
MGSIGSRIFSLLSSGSLWTLLRLVMSRTKSVVVLAICTPDKVVNKRLRHALALVRAQQDLRYAPKVMTNSEKTVTARDYAKAYGSTITDSEFVLIFYLL